MKVLTVVVEADDPDDEGTISVECKVEVTETDGQLKGFVVYSQGYDLTNPVNDYAIELALEKYKADKS